MALGGLFSSFFRLNNRIRTISTRDPAARFETVLNCQSHLVWAYFGDLFGVEKRLGKFTRASHFLSCL